MHRPLIGINDVILGNYWTESYGDITITNTTNGVQKTDCLPA